MAMNDISVDFEQFYLLVQTLAQKIEKTDWQPDYIVGVVGSGAIAAVMLGVMLDKPVWTLKVNLTDPEQCECNAWMPDDAVNGKNILVVDAVNSTGDIFHWIEKDWHSSVAGIANPSWDTIWNFNIRLAVLVDNPDSAYPVDFTGIRTSFTACKFPWDRKKIS